MVRGAGGVTIVRAAWDEPAAGGPRKAALPWRISGCGSQEGETSRRGETDGADGGSCQIRGVVRSETSRSLEGR